MGRRPVITPVENSLAPLLRSCELLHSRFGLVHQKLRCRLARARDGGCACAVRGTAGMDTCRHASGSYVHIRLWTGRGLGRCRSPAAHMVPPCTHAHASKGRTHSLRFCWIFALGVVASRQRLTRSNLEYVILAGFHFHRSEERAQLSVACSILSTPRTPGPALKPRAEGRRVQLPGGAANCARSIRVCCCSTVAAAT